ncbi:MAG: S41 family peptidase, partial [Bacilli bacterium]|nr:S41 family peptidase [Bacilli bacterium]
KKVEIVNDNKTKEKELYTSKEVIIVMIFSIGIGILMCFGGISIITGKNYLAVTKDLKKVVDTYYAIVDNYYGELDKDKLIDGAVEGMISSVGDTFTSYSDTESTSSFDETINGSYEGIGCTVATLEDGTISVIDMFDDSPSYKAGLKVGDVILKVDGESYEGKNSNDISNYIKNSGKSKIVLTVKRNNEEKDISINLSKVEIPHVSGKVIEQDNKKIGYIKISLFASNSYKQFKNKLDELEKSNIDDLIIDVRDNSGGYLSSVTDICNLFLDKGKVIYQLEDSKGKVKKKDTTKEKRKYDIVVLINGGSASASEILASAIKESYGGDIVGTNSYGKGTVQQTKKLLDGSMIKYTTQKWLTPDGNSINEVGVTPTKVVELNEEYFNNPTTENDNQLQEAINIIIK